METKIEPCKEYVNLSYLRIPPQNPVSCKYAHKHEIINNISADKPVLFHERAFSAVLQIYIIRIEVAFRRYDHNLR